MRFAPFVCLWSLVLAAPVSHAQTPPPFNCGPEAYLFQGDTTGLYALDLATGQATLLKAHILPTGPNQILNAFGYNRMDDYIWGARRNTGQLVRIAADYSDSLFSIQFLPAASYNVGDIDANGVMYLYDSGSTTIYRIDLNPLSINYLQQLPPLPTTPAVIYDWAFSPVDGNLYAVDTLEQVFRYNPNTGARQTLGTATGGGIGSATGSFGAAYMDVAGNMYLSENDSGYIFRIDTIHTGNVAATFFAQGPASSVNDGARCATAVVPTGIGEGIPGVAVTVYPNPFGDLLQVSWADPSEAELALYDITGRQVFRGRFSGSARIPTRRFGSGVYWLKVTVDDKIAWRQILKRW
jgi:hypothetical protein